MSLNLRTAALISLGYTTATVPLRMVLLESVLMASLPVRVRVRVTMSILTGSG